MSNQALKGVGFCDNVNCKYYHRSSIMISGSGKFYCKDCDQPGFVELETINDPGRYDDAKTTVYKTVRIHFSYNPSNRKYEEIAIADIPEIRTGYQYDVYSPYVNSPARALRMAESTLCSINSGIKGTQFREIVINFDNDNWKEQLQNLGEVLDGRERRVMNAIR